MKKSETLAYKLSEYVDTGVYPWHMPGHKRRLPSEYKNFMKDIYKIDLTEVGYTDNLHMASGIIKDAMQYAAKAYGAKNSYFLVNGSSCGILASIYAICKDKGKIIIADNAHISAFNAVELIGKDRAYFLKTKEIMDTQISAGADINEIKLLIKNKDIKAVYITSPSYDGIISDVKSIADLCHENNIILIVDEAHGAHLKFMKKGASALENDADIVIQSLHKTLPCLTQGAILHINSDRVSKKDIEQALRIFETSSPSYVLMSGMDLAIRYSFTDAGIIIEKYLKELEKFRKIKLTNFEIFSPNDLDKKKYDIKDIDETKIVLLIRDKSKIEGIELQNILRDYNIEVEMARESYILFLSTYLDSKSAFNKLKKAIKEIDNALSRKDFQKIRREALDINLKIEELDKQKYKPCKNEIYVYPPGIPLLKKGEYLDEKSYLKIRRYIEKGYKVFI